MKKKIAIALISILAVVVMALSFAACGLAGTYKLEELSVTENGEVLTAKAGEDLSLEGGSWLYPVDDDDVVITFKSDGTYSVTMRLPRMDKAQHSEGKWEEKDGKINILDDDGKVTQTFTVENNRIVWEVEGLYKIVLKK